MISSIQLSKEYESYYTISDNSVEFKYGGFPYPFYLSQGKYLIEAYGASGGGHNNYYSSSRNTYDDECIDQSIVEKYKGNTVCKKLDSVPGAGAYISGILDLKFPIRMYVVVGGSGNYQRTPGPGGYNGGGSRLSNASNSGGSGGGATDFRALKNTLYHRILVAGGGGGSDNAYGNRSSTDDGSGGSGGYPSQGFWISGKYQSKYETNSTYGFSFGQGQASAVSKNEQAGAGGGFFGGFSIDDCNAGAGGGSSFALSREIPIPNGLIVSKDENGTFIEKKKYAFTHSSSFLLKNVEMATGIWIGNGLARITVLETYDTEIYPVFACTCGKTTLSKFNFIIISLINTK